MPVRCNPYHLIHPVMKRLLTLASLCLTLVVGSSLLQKASAQPGVGVSVSYQTFYDELSPYGEWIDYPEYGYVWQPSLGSGFQPYSTNGHWVWSDEYEWIWVSDYAWGWGPFHYGRWFQDPGYGWMWQPGYDWSPAWVSWRTGGDYYGWAPIRPGININIGFGNYNPPSNYWCFAPRRYINSPRINNYYVDRSRNVTIINNTTIINNNYGRRGNNIYVNGPRRDDAARYAGNIRSVRVRDASRPGAREVRGSNVSLYRPRIDQSSGNRRDIAPRNVRRYEAGQNAVREGQGRPDRGFVRTEGNSNNQDGRAGDRTTGIGRDRVNRENRISGENREVNQNPNRRVFEREASPRQSSEQTADRTVQQRGQNQSERPHPFDRRSERPQPEQRHAEQRQTEQRQAEQPQRERPRMFERREQPQRQEQSPRSVERAQQQQQRSFERPQQQQSRSVDRPQQREQPQRSFERPQQQQPQQQRSFERPQQPQQQRSFERPQQQQQQQRSFERPQQQTRSSSPAQQSRNFERAGESRSRRSRD